MARTRELARIGSNLNQIARWANIHKEDADVLEVVAHLGRAGARHSGRRGGARAMMIKFLARGTGSAAAAADYLTRERSPEHDSDPQKNPEEVKVLRGNPDQVAAVADTLEFEHKYTSGVIAWAPEDNPSDAQIGRVVDEFEKTAWARTRTGPLRLERGPAPRSGRGLSTCISWRRAATWRPARV